VINDLMGYYVAVSASDAFDRAVQSMKEAERKTLDLVQRQKNRDVRKKLARVHKSMIKHRRLYAQIQEDRGQIVGNLYD